MFYLKTNIYVFEISREIVLWQWFGDVFENQQEATILLVFTKKEAVFKRLTSRKYDEKLYSAGLSQTLTACCRGDRPWASLSPLADYCIWYFASFLYRPGREMPSRAAAWSLLPPDWRIASSSRFFSISSMILVRGRLPMLALKSLSAGF